MENRSIQSFNSTIFESNIVIHVCLLDEFECYIFKISDGDVEYCYKI